MRTILRAAEGAKESSRLNTASSLAVRSGPMGQSNGEYARSSRTVGSAVACGAAWAAESPSGEHHSRNRSKASQNAFEAFRERSTPRTEYASIAFSTLIV